MAEIDRSRAMVGIGRVAMTFVCALVFTTLAGLNAPNARAGFTKLGETGVDKDVTERNEALARLRDALAAVPKVGRTNDAKGHRRALVIGNDGYRNIRKLKKAVGDSTSISAALRSLDFTVTSVTDVDTETFDARLDEFIESLQPGDTAVLFYSGHGVAFEGKNYLLPVDVPTIGVEDGRRIRRLAVDASEIVERLRLKQIDMALMVLDACRDDPFENEDTRGGAPMGGLKAMQPAQNMFVIYSAGVGEKALDNLGSRDTDQNSVFTRKFIPILETPGLPLVDIAKRTQVEVRELARTVRHKQAPAYYDQVIGQYYFRPPQPKVFGFSIGIGDYERENMRFKGGSNDGTRVARALASLKPSRMVRILDRDARLQFVEFAWADLVAEAEPGDTIVFSFSGLTGRRPAGPNSGEADGMDEFLKLANFSATSDDAASDDEILTDDKLTSWMEAAAARNINVILLIDGSSGGGLLDRQFANVSFMGAIAEGYLTKVYRVDGLEHGAASAAFAHAVEGAADINGDGFISQRELFYFMSKDVLDIARMRQTVQFAPTLGETGSATDIPLLKLPVAAGQAENVSTSP